VAAATPPATGTDDPVGPVIERVVDAYLGRHWRAAAAAHAKAMTPPLSHEALQACDVPFWSFVNECADPGIGTGLRREYIRAAGASLLRVRLMPPFGEPAVWETPLPTGDAPLLRLRALRDDDVALRMIESMATQRPDLIQELARKQADDAREDANSILHDVHPRLVAAWVAGGFPYETHPRLMFRDLQTICLILTQGHGSPELAAALGLTSDKPKGRTAS
jgi:hypothetical protein